MPTRDVTPDAGRFGCGACFEGEAEAAWERVSLLSSVAELVDESHFDLSILACPKCGQRYLKVFTELIDWKDGDDSQASAIVPLAEEEPSQVQAWKDSPDLKKIEAWVAGRRFLRWIHPCGGETLTSWVDGGFVFMPHD